MVLRGQWRTYWEEVFWDKFVYRTQREWGEGKAEEPDTHIHIDLLISFVGLQWELLVSRVVRFPVGTSIALFQILCH